MLNVRDISCMCGVIDVTVRRWINEGKLKAQKTWYGSKGRPYMVLDADFCKFYNFL